MTLDDKAEAVNLESYAPPAYRKVEIINDELHIIRRLLENPSACTSAPEIMDVVRMAVQRVHSRYESLAQELRFESERRAGAR